MPFFYLYTLANSQKLVNSR